MESAWALVGTVLFASSCGDGDEGPWLAEPQGSVHVLEDGFSRSASERLYLLLVVDDAQDAQGTALRAGLSAGLDRALRERVFPMRTAGDPLWQPIHLSVAVVWPSASEEERLLVPLDEPALQLDVRDRRVGDLEQWIARLAVVLAEPPRRARPYMPMAAVSSLWRLLSGERSSQSRNERRLSEVLGGERSGIFVHVASAHDDESPGSVGDYEVESGGILELSDASGEKDGRLPPSWFRRGSAVFLSAALECPDAAPRLANWASVSSLAFERGSCGQYPELEHPFTIFSETHGPRGSRCMPMHLSIDPKGSVDCRVLIELEGEERGCPNELGWSRPVESFHLASRELLEGATLCEVRQLEGAALDACANRRALDPSESGWCVVADPQLVANCQLHQQKALQFVGGALGEIDLSVHIACRLDGAVGH